MSRKAPIYHEQEEHIIKLHYYPSMQGSICRWGCWGLTPALVSVTPVLVWEIRTRWGRILTPALLLFFTAEGVNVDCFPPLDVLWYLDVIFSVTNVLSH